MKAAINATDNVKRNINLLREKYSMRQIFMKKFLNLYTGQKAPHYKIQREQQKNNLIHNISQATVVYAVRV